MARVTRRRWLVALTVGLAVLCFALATTVALRRSSHAVAGVPVVERGKLPDLTRPAARTSAAPAKPGQPAVPAGTQVRMPRLGVAATVVHVAAPGGVMQIPADPAVLGWWSGGASPGSTQGRVVIVGHVNLAGQAGALSVLPQARPGDAVTVSEPHNGSAVTFRYSVDAVRTYPKSGGLPQQLFGRGGAAELVLITCGGSFDASTGNYLDNIVVLAHPVTG